MAFFSSKLQKFYLKVDGRGWVFGRNSNNCGVDFWRRSEFGPLHFHQMVYLKNVQIQRQKKINKKKNSYFSQQLHIDGEPTVVLVARFGDQSVGEFFLEH